MNHAAALQLDLCGVQKDVTGCHLCEENWWLAKFVLVWPKILVLLQCLVYSCTMAGKFFFCRKSFPKWIAVELWQSNPEWMCKPVKKKVKRKPKRALKNKQNAYFASQIVDSVHLYVSFSVGITLPPFDLVPDTMHHLDMPTKGCCLVTYIHFYKQWWFSTDQFESEVTVCSLCKFDVRGVHYRCRVHCQRATLKTAARDAQAWRRGKPNLNWVWLFTLHGWNCKSLWLHLKEMRLVSFTSSSSIHISISLWFNTYLKQNFVMEHLKYFFFCHQSH